MLKGQESINGLVKWLRGNPSAPSTERLIAQSLLDDLLNALKGL